MKIFKIAVKGVIYNKDKILIVKRSAIDDTSPLHWEFPGGCLEFGESLEDGLTREIKEEVGLDVLIKNIIYSWSKTKNDTQIIGINFECESINSEVKLSEEHCDYEWVKLSELKDFVFSSTLWSDIKNYILKN